MNILNLNHPSKKLKLILLLVFLLAAIPLAVYQLQQQQFFRQFAWHTNQSAVATCPTDNESVAIQLSFTNSETSKDMDVKATDLQTKETVDLGTVKHGETMSGQINTGLSTIDDGSVIFNLKWTDKSPGTDAFKADYKGIEKCPSPTPTIPFCPADQPKNQGYCRWDLQENAVAYDVVIKETESGNIIKSETLQHPASQSAFLLEPNKTYQCIVNSVNACGAGVTTEGPQKNCPALTPTPTVPYCPAQPDNEAVCVWDDLPGAKEYIVTVIDFDTGKPVKSVTVDYPTNRVVFEREPGITYQCKVSAVNICSVSEETEGPPSICSVPTPTPTGTPSITPSTSPTPTNTPSITPTDVPIPTPSTGASPTPTPTTPPTPTPSPTPTATPTPSPTPTPTRVPTPTPTLQPTPTPTLSPTPTPTPTPTIVVNTPTPTPTTPPGVIANNTPIPSIAPTGLFETTTIIAVATILITVIGAFLFIF